MQKSQFSSSHIRTSRSRLMTAVLATFSLLAVLGLAAEPVDAQGSSQFVFQGAGWGHGVGMSQNGARNAADSGVDHVGILNHYYPNTVLSPVPTLDAIRVHIGDASRVEFSSAGSMVFERGGVAINSLPSGTISISAHDGGLQIGAAWTTASFNDPVFVSFPEPVKVSNNGHRYLWGKLQLTNKNGKVRVVEVLPLEQYVAGIAEMPAAWPLEALMAQAIAARTYAHEVTLHRRNSDEWAQEYDISGTTVDQNYIGYDAQDSAWDQKWIAAVKATAAVEIVDSNGPIRAYYSATNGGYTETAAYVFNNDVPYTVAGPDPYDEGGHDWTTWTRTYTQQSMSRWLNAHSDTAVGTLTSIAVLDGAGASARIDKAVVELQGTSGTKRVTGKRLMLVINAGVFGEGGGLSTHLPGTFTTVGNGVGAGQPQPTGVLAVAAITPDPVDEDTNINDGFTPPPGWRPEPGTGIAPGSPAAVEADVDGDAAPAPNNGNAPPPGWVPIPGTGIAPNQGNGAAAEEPVPTPLAVATAPAANGNTPPPGWVPIPGTGIPPIRPGTGVPPTTAITPAPAATPTPETLPLGFVPQPGTGIAPNDDSDVVGGTGGGDVEAVTTSLSALPGTPPPGWTPVPGTGVQPFRAATTSSASSSAAASGVLLVERTANGADEGEANFEVIAPTEDLADEARERLEELQSGSDLAVEDYVAALAPRPARGVCITTVEGVVCVPVQGAEEDE